MKWEEDKIFVVCTLTTIVYFVTFIAARIFGITTHLSVDIGRKFTGPFIGTCLIIIPYIFNGLCCRKLFSNAFKGALKTSLILVISERTLIYLIGFLIVSGGGEHPFDDRTAMMFIQSEAAPYFTIPYILAGVFSISISMVVALAGKASLSTSK